MAITVAELVAKLQADTSHFVSGMRDAERQLKTTEGAFGAVRKQALDFGASLGPVGGMLTSALLSPEAAVAGLGAAIGKFAFDGVKDFVRLADEVRHFSQVSGATATDSSKFVAAMAVFGIGADTGATSIFRLSQNLGKHADALAADGVELAKNAQGQTDLVGTVMNIGDAYKNLQDPVEKNKLLFDAFGRSGQALIPILGQSREQLQSLFDSAAAHHEILTQDQINQALAFKIATHDLNEAFTGLGRELGATILPILTQLARGFEREIGWVDSLAHAIGSLIPGHHDAAAAAVDQTVATGDLTVAFEESTKAAAAFKTTVFSVESAQRALDAANRTVEADTRNVASAQRTLNDLLATGAVNAKAVESATRALESANRSAATAEDNLQKATQGVLDAQQAVADLASGKTAAEELAKHHNDLAHAQLGVKTATSGLAHAQDNLKTLQDSGTATALQLSDAHLQVDQAVLTLSDSNDHLTSTQDALNQMGKIGAENSPEMVKARENEKTAIDHLKDSTQAVADANQNVIDKQGALTTALSGDPAFYSKVQTARQGVADATNNLKDAQYAASQKAYDLQVKTGDLETALEGAGGKADALRQSLKDIIALAPGTAPFINSILNALPVAETISAFSSWINAQKALPPGVAGPVLPAGPMAPHALGGTVAGQIGSPQMIMAHGGERIIPVGQAGTPGAVYTINVSGALDADGTARAIQKILLDLNRRTGSLGFN